MTLLTKEEKELYKKAILTHCSRNRDLDVPKVDGSLLPGYEIEFKDNKISARWCDLPNDGRIKVTCKLTYMKRLYNYLWEEKTLESNPVPPITKTSEETILVSTEEIQKTFTEWERRYREDPESFENEATRLLRVSPDTYGKVCAPYFIKILKDIQSNKKL